MICRPAIDAAFLVARCEELGATTVLLPLFEAAEPRDGGVALAAAIDRLPSYRWLGLTSVNGVRAVVNGLSSRRLLPASLRVAAVGTATATALTAAGISVDLMPEAATAADLAAAFPLAGGDETVLTPLGELASTDLTDGLYRRGYHVHRVEAYRMAPSEVDPSSGEGADIAVLTSPSIAARFAAVFPAAVRPATVLCIGPRTAARATEAGIQGVITAASHNTVGLVEALLALERPTCSPSGPSAT